MTDLERHVFRVRDYYYYAYHYYYYVYCCYLEAHLRLPAQRQQLVEVEVVAHLSRGGGGIGAREGGARGRVAGQGAGHGPG